MNNDVTRLKYSDIFPQNSERVINQNNTPMMIIIGNPPYSIGQKSANDNAQNETYPNLEKRIEDTYGVFSNSKLQKGLYDSYIKAFRLASDRIDTKDGGIIGFVTNAGWLDGAAMDGLRKCFEEEFTSIYVFNLRGNQRTQGEKSRQEGGKIFGSGSRTPVAITILVKNPKANNIKANIYYRDIGDYLTREQKLNVISKQKSVTAYSFTQKVIKPNEHGDWLNQRSELFSKYIPISPLKKIDQQNHSYFIKVAPGLVTSRDAWCYNFSMKCLSNNILKFIKNYDIDRKNIDHLQARKLTTDNTKISWSVNLQKFVTQNKVINYNPYDIVTSSYRPFVKEYLYFSKYLNERPGQMSKLFTNSNHDNLAICISGIGGTKEFSCIITNEVPDFQFNFNAQCFPLYWYEEEKQNTVMNNLFNETNNVLPKKEYNQHDGITDFILNEAHSIYKTDSITKEDIFYYVYGILHSSDYRKQFAADLKKMLPRIPLVDNSADFKAFSAAGRKLAGLHLSYEKHTPPAEVVVEGDNGHNYKVTKMKFKSKADKSEIIYNNQITIKNIPSEAYDYVVNGRSAIEWIMERYQVKTDKASQITNDPNDWAEEHNDPRYILDLLLSIITVSVETVKIVNNLPKLKFE